MSDREPGYFDQVIVDARAVIDHMDAIIKQAQACLDHGWYVETITDIRERAAACQRAASRIDGNTARADAAGKNLPNPDQSWMRVDRRGGD